MRVCRYVFDFYTSPLIRSYDNAFFQGGQQEDAEEFLGFYLDTLEEELLHIQNSLTPLPPSSKSARHLVEEKEEPEIPEDGWLEVGKKNRTIVTRTVSIHSSIYFILMDT